MNTEQATSGVTLEKAVNSLVIACHGASLAGGWWTDTATGKFIKEDEKLFKDIIGWKLSLIHSEVSEATEGFRKGKMDDHLPHRQAAEVELADAIIRICDLAGAAGFNLGAALAEKMEYNSKRADHKPEARKAAGGKTY